MRQWGRPATPPSSQTPHPSLAAGHKLSRTHSRPYCAASTARVPIKNPPPHPNPLSKTKCYTIHKPHQSTHPHLPTPKCGPSTQNHVPSQRAATARRLQIAFSPTPNLLDVLSRCPHIVRPPESPKRPARPKFSGFLGKMPLSQFPTNAGATSQPLQDKGSRPGVWQ